MSSTVWRTSLGMSTYVVVVISPATSTRPVVNRVSHATRLSGSSARTASRTESEIWSTILSGWPSVTDSDVKEKLRLFMAGRLAHTGEELRSTPGSEGAPPTGERGSGSRLPALRERSLLSGFPPHQARGELGDVLAGEDCADAFRDRQLDAEPVREVAQNRCRRQPFHRLPDLGHRPLGRETLRHQLAGGPVAAVAAPARDHEVADPREPGEGLGPCAGRLPESRHLGEAARDERRLRVVAEAQAVDAPRRERDHVLRRA